MRLVPVSQSEINWPQFKNFCIDFKLKNLSNLDKHNQELRGIANFIKSFSSSLKIEGESILRHVHFSFLAELPDEIVFELALGDEVEVLPLDKLDTSLSKELYLLSSTLRGWKEIIIRNNLILLPLLNVLILFFEHNDITFNDYERVSYNDNFMLMVKR